MKKIIKNSIKTIIIIIIAVLILSLSYMFVVYLEFISNKESIFSKIEDFSKGLRKNTETNITLGLDGEDEEDGFEKKVTYFLDRNDKIIAQYSPQKHILIPLRRIPYFVSRGFLLVEDNRFYKHSGINIIRLGLGIINNIFTLGHSPGGSTISQQLAKILFTKQKKTIKRKVYELYCTFELEKRFTKNEILQIYLNSIYLGHGIYGIANASQFYFGKSAAELTIAEAALLIGMNRSPENYSPIKYRENAKRIQKVVLNQFHKEDYISKKDMVLEITRFWRNFDIYGAVGNQSFWKTDINASGYITELIRQILEKELTYEKITRGGLIVKTTIDIEKQAIAEKVVLDQLKYIKKKVKKTVEDKNIEIANKKNLDNIEAGLVSIDYRNAEVLVIVGGSGYSFANQFNRAIQAYRPIGSSVKPFVYAEALNEGKLGEKDIHPFSRFKDEIVTYTINGKKYEPKNYYYDHKYGDMVTMYDALKRSLNTISVKVLDQMEVSSVADLIRKAAFLNTRDEKKRVPEVLSLALGTCELSPFELATAYSIFANGGKPVYPKLIKKIYDSKGNVYYDISRKYNPYFNDLYDHDLKEEKELIRPEIAYEIVQMMRSVFEDGGTGYWPAYITGFNVPAYAKSGTTEDYRDGWFAGFTDREVSTVWVGLDNNEPIYLAGSATAGVLWCEYNKKASSNITRSINKPRNMKLIKVCVETGLEAVSNCPIVKDFYFWKDGPLPEKCYIHGEYGILDIED